MNIEDKDFPIVFFTTSSGAIDNLFLYSSMETPLMGQLINVSSRRSTHQFSAVAAAAASSRGRPRATLHALLD